MPNVIETPEYVQEDRTPMSVASPASRGRVANLFAALRTWLWPRREWGAASHTPPFETGMDMLVRQHPDSFIRAISV
jgi:hypothetical protein